MKDPKLSIDQPWRIWIFVLGLNAIAFIGLFILKAKGIDVYAFKGGA